MNTWLQGYAEEGEWIRERFLCAWKDDEGKPLSPIAWDNVGFVPPAGPWVRLTIQHVAASQASIGPDPIHRHEGSVAIEIFVPARTHTAAAADLADRAAEIFRGARDYGIRFFAPLVRRIGGRPDDDWFRLTVLCPFQRDTVFSTSGQETE